MKRIYNTGDDANIISLAVKVGTKGVAFTAVRLARSGGQVNKIADSEERMEDKTTGNISERPIGEARVLRNAYLVIRTLIDLINIDESEWEDEIKKIIIHYHLKGGFSGHQVFNYDNDDVDIVFEGRKIIITKPIELI